MYYNWKYEAAIKSAEIGAAMVGDTIEGASLGLIPKDTASTLVKHRLEDAADLIEDHGEEMMCFEVGGLEEFSDGKMCENEAFEEAT